MIPRFVFFLTILFVSISFLPETTFSATSVQRGNSATINWQATNTDRCSPSTNYPVVADNVNTSWTSTNPRAASGSLTFGAVYGNSNAAFPQTYTFYCTPPNPPGGQEGSDTLTVTDCPSGYRWNGSSCVVNSCPNGATNPTACTTCPSGYTMVNNQCVAVNTPTADIWVNPLSVDSGGYYTYGWSSTNATRCTFSLNGSVIASTDNPYGFWYFNNSGSQDGPVTTAKTWGISCQNASGTANDSATISVNYNNASCGGGGPYTVTAGQTFPFSYTMSNNGSKQWNNYDTTPHSLGVANDSTTFGTNRIQQATPAVNPGQSKAFTGNLTAPTTPGTYTLNVRMVEDGVEWFGATCPVTITVQGPATAPTCSSTGVLANPIYGGTSNDVYAYGVSSNATSVYFPTWTQTNGQDDLIWYPGTNMGGGTWKATVPFSNHGNAYDYYNVHIYMNAVGYTNIGCGQANFTRSPASPAPTVTANVSPSPSIYVPNSFRVTMSSTNATSCTWSRTGSYSGNWSNQPLPSGTSYDSGNLFWGTGNATWTFSCTGTGGTAQGSASVTVSAPPANTPILTLNATAPTNVNVNWDCNNPYARSGKITRVPTASSISLTNFRGSANDPAAANTTYSYTFTCYAEEMISQQTVVGQTSANVTTPPVASVSLTANNCTIGNNQRTCTSPVSWTTSSYSNPYLGWCTQPGCTSAGTQAGATGSRNFSLVGDPAVSTYVYVNGNGATVAAKTIRGNCGANQVWNASWPGGGSCRPATCPNGAANFPTCTFVTPTLTLTPTNPQTISVGWNCNSVNALSASFVRTPGGSSLGNVAVSGNNVPDTGAPGASYVYAITCWSNSQAGQGQITGSTTASVVMPNYPTITVDCGNGSTNYPNCNECPSGQVFDGVRCVDPGSTLSCGGVSNPISGNYTFPVCGNGTIETGEECDGTLGITSPSTQQCSNSCTITCKNGSSDSPNCGSCPAGRVSVGGTCVAQCTNGALQSSAPACTTCPSGQTYTGGRCVSPICGNNTIEGTEQCDGTAGITNPSTQSCTYGCCLQAATTTLSSFRVTCLNTTNYNIVKISDGSTILNGGYTGPFIFTPTQPDTYRVTCTNAYASTNTLITATQMQAPDNVGMTLTANPKTIRRNGSTALSWTTPVPNTLCKIIAMPTITAPSPACNTWCVIQRLNEAARLNSALANGYTDSSDPYGAGRTMYQAVKGIVGGGETRARGKKSVQLKYSQTFISSCGVNPLRDDTAPRVKVQVTEDIEG